MTTIAELQDRGHTADHDYGTGSPHLTHPQLRTEIVRRLSELVAEQFARQGRVRVLEVGAGHGSFTDHLLAFGAEVTATEMSRASAEHLRRRYEHNPSATVLYDADGSLAAADGPFDLVFAASVLHHIPDYLAAVAGWIPLLAPGGAFFTVEDPMRYDHVGRWTHTAQFAARYLWRLGQPDRTVAVRNLLRRTSNGFDETRTSDMVEYHVLRDGVDEQALTALLRTSFDDVAIWPYWSTPSPALQRLGERGGLTSNFALTARRRH